ncbi:hypothetical protein Gotri_028232 [Gossypium trilobum]|uniref:Uncharacterized protein n=1 Tax=Gossypium trilobum TaxID=34281 RepID=A0A7J9FKZ1_9ROSI|nr:hypothetical protein [Gossypium trilobum]
MQLGSRFKSSCQSTTAFVSVISLTEARLSDNTRGNCRCKGLVAQG